MTRRKQASILALGFLIVVLPIAIRRGTPEAKAVNRILKEYRIAEPPILRPDSTDADAKKFLDDLKKIDLTGAPRDVRDSMAHFISSVESNLMIRAQRGDTNGANDDVGFARDAFLKSIEKHNGQPF